MMPETYSGCATYASDEETRLTSDFDRSITLGRRGGWRRFRDRRARSMVEKSMVDGFCFCRRGVCVAVAVAFDAPRARG